MTSIARQAGGDTANQIEVLDVWSRTSRGHRLQAILMLVLLALLFAGLCCFTFWLRTGAYIPWRHPDYADLMRRSFSPWASDQITLSDFLSSPIRVQDVPIHGVIMGLQFASLSSIPILVAILYRLPVAIFFGLMVVLLTAMPWMGVTVILGCVLTSMGMFRFTFRYASALIGLIPIAIYFIAASWEPSAARPEPTEHQALLYAPWVLAMLGSCVICAVALSIARLINYRPGGIPPVLAALFATPVFLFHAHVGRHELAYRLLEGRIGLGSASVFAPVDLAYLARRETLRRWSRSEEASHDEVFRQVFRSMKDEALLQAERDRFGAAEDCDTFIERFPRSIYVPNVLYLKARALDHRIDGKKLEAPPHRVEFRADYPNRGSARAWQTLAERFPSDELSLVALHRLAILDGREGEFDAALQSLETLIGRIEADRSTTHPAQVGDDTVMRTAFERRPPSSHMGIDVDSLYLRARRLREMLMACRDEKPRPISSLFGPRSGGSDVLTNPVQLLLRFDDADPRYEMNLIHLTRAFRNSHTAGYAEVRLALLERAISRRIQRLELAAEALSGRPPGAEARFYLGDARQEDSLLDEAKLAFEESVRAYPKSCWSQEAKQRLASLSLLQQASQ